MASAEKLGVNIGPIFQFTRHAHSCNNLVQDKLGKLNRKSLSLRSSERDPGLTMFGVLSCLKKAYMLKHAHDDRYIINGNDEQVVFVSCLKRTWMTAILLYAYSPKTALTLIVSPYLKESDIALKYPRATSLARRASNIDVRNLDGGNLPKKFSEQCGDMKEFFNGLEWLYTIAKSFKESYSVEYIKEVLDKLNGKNIIIKYKHTTFSLRLNSKSGDISIYNQEYFNINNRIINNRDSYKDIYSRHSQRELYDLLEGRLAEVDSSEDTRRVAPADYIPPEYSSSEPDEYDIEYKQSDLSKFIEWVSSSEYCNGSQCQTFFNCVSHSDVMRTFVKRFYLHNSGERNKNPYYKFAVGNSDAAEQNHAIKKYLKNMNIWDFIYTNDDDPINIYYGYEKPNKDEIKKLNLNCERNCSFGAAIQDKVQQCSGELQRERKIYNEGEEKPVEVTDTSSETSSETASNASTETPAATSTSRLTSFVKTISSGFNRFLGRKGGRTVRQSRNKILRGSQGKRPCTRPGGSQGKRPCRNRTHRSARR